jgi:DNA-binding GntR family transcriptional regulator
MDCISPGDRLLEADVAAEFKVSHSPVREALQALESEGTLIAAPYSGAITRTKSGREAFECNRRF